jgi:hypothetical protein
MDWNNYNTATSDYVRINWAIATVLSSTIMATAMLYIVTEWCLQSHLSTASMSDAARGLYLTRRFRWLTSPFRDAIHYAIEGVYAVRKLFESTKSHNGTDHGIAEPRQHRRSVRWTKKPAKESHHKNATNGISLEDLTPGRPRASSDAPLIMSNDASTDPPSVLDADAASHRSSQSPRASSEDRTTPEIESPSRLHVPEARSAPVRYASDRRLSV